MRRTSKTLFPTSPLPPVPPSFFSIFHYFPYFNQSLTGRFLTMILFCSFQDSPTIIPISLAPDRISFFFPFLFFTFLFWTRFSPAGQPTAFSLQTDRWKWKCAFIDCHSGRHLAANSEHLTSAFHVGISIANGSTSAIQSPVITGNRPATFKKLFERHFCVISVLSKVLWRSTTSSFVLQMLQNLRIPISNYRTSFL